MCRQNELDMRERFFSSFPKSPRLIAILWHHFESKVMVILHPNCLLFLHQFYNSVSIFHFCARISFFTFSVFFQLIFC